MEVSALKYSGGIGLHARSPLLRLQSDERLVALVRRGNTSAFEVLVSRYESRLQAFCRHLLGSREDAEDVLQEVLAAAFNAMLADERPINVKPWLYRIARNRSLNHLRRSKAIGVDSMDVHLSDNGQSTAEKVHEREEFRLLVGDIHELPETQKTALVLREMDALTYEQIAEAMETTVPSVKSLLVRARVSLAEAAEARLLSCDEVRIELGELAEGLRRKPSPLVRRHLKTCNRCSAFRDQLKDTNKALAAIMPLGPLVVLKKLIAGHVGHSAGSGATASGAAGSGAAAGGTALAGSAGGFVSAGVGAIATKAAAGLAAAVLVTGAAVEVTHSSHRQRHHAPTLAFSGATAAVAANHLSQANSTVGTGSHVLARSATAAHAHHAARKAAANTSTRTSTTSTASSTAARVTSSSVTTTSSAATSTVAPRTPTSSTPPGRTQVQSDPTVLAPTPPPTVPATPTPPAATAPVVPAPPTSTSSTTGSATPTDSSSTTITSTATTSAADSSAPSSDAPATDTGN